MKKLTLCLLIGALAATAVLSGCSTSKSSSAASNGDTSSKATSVSVAEKTEEVTEAEEKAIVVFEENGLKLTYTGFEDDIIPKFTFML